MQSHKLIFSIFFTIYCNLFAQHSSFINYNVESGLPFETIFTCLEDNEGYMWFSSSHGVARYDGQNWMYFTSDAGLPDNDVLSMFLDESGRVWFATFNGELSYYFNGRIFNSEDHLFFKLNKIENGIATIFEDSRQVKWLNPIKNSFSSIDDYEFKKYKLPNELQHLKGFIFEIKNEIYLFSRNFIFKLVDEDFILNKHYSTPLNVRSYYYKTDDKSLVYLTDRGIVKLLESGYTKVLIPINELPDWKTIGDVYLTRDDRLSVSTINDGVFIYSNYKYLDFSNHHILNNVSITDCVEDYSGNLWYSTINQGVFFIPSNYDINHLLSENERLMINKINSFELEDDGTLWLGSDDGYLFKKTKDSFEKINLNNIYTKSSIVYNQINDIIIKNNELFVVTNNGLFNIQKDNLNEKYFITKIDSEDSYSPKKVFKDKLGNITTSLSMGIYKLVKDNRDSYNQSTIPEIPYSRNFSHVVAEDGSIWHVTIDEVHKRSSTTLESYDITQYGITQRVKEIELLNDSTFVLTTNGQGVFVISSGKLVANLNKSSGLSSNAPSRVKIVDGNIWLSSNYGLDKVVFENNTVKGVYNFNNHLDFSTHNVNDFHVNDSVIIVCNNTDIKVISNNWVETELAPPNVYINTVSSNDSILTLGAIQLKKNSNLSIDCSVINFNRSSEIYYEFKLDGIHEDWVSTKLKHVEFTSLQPGEYTFKYRARRQSGNWSRPASFSFIVETPLSENPIVIIGYLIVMLAVILWVILWLFKNSHNKKIQKVERNYQIISLEQKALQAMMNPHFIFNVLNSIQYYLMSDNADKAQVNLTKFAKLIRKNLEINQEKFISIDEEIEYLRLYLALEKLRFNESFEYNISVDSAIIATEINIPTMLIQPFIENAIWHGIMPQGGAGTVSIEFRLKDDSLYVYICDNGVGYNPNKVSNQTTHKSVGLKMTKERMMLMQSIYNEEFDFCIEPVSHIDSSISGTKVTLKLPINLL